MESVPDAGRPAFHGYRGPNAGATFLPPLTLVISRQSGSRGRLIAREIANRLGWQLLTQEALEHMATQDQTGNEPELPRAADDWVASQCMRLRDEGHLDAGPWPETFTKILLQMAAAEPSVILGRGVGALLPADATIHVRLIAPMQDRIGYISQEERLTPDEAAAIIRQRDEQRGKFLAATYHVAIDDLTQYDMVLNTSRFGVAGSTEVIVAAVRERQQPGEPLPGGVETE